MSKQNIGIGLRITSYSVIESNEPDANGSHDPFFQIIYRMGKMVLITHNYDKIKKLPDTKPAPYVQPRYATMNRYRDI